MPKVKLTNYEMSRRRDSLRSLLELKGKVGYAAGRNSRFLDEQLVEYDRQKTDLLKQYGKPTDYGYAISPNDPNFPQFEAKMREFDEVEHKVELFLVPESLAEEHCTGQQYYENAWMFEKEDDGDGAA